MIPLNDHQSGHSEFQIERFIVARGNPTPYGRYKQLLREIDKRRRAIEDLDLQRQLLSLDCERAASTVGSYWSLFRSRQRRDRRRIKLAQLRSKRARLERDRAETSRELACLESLAAEIAPAIGKLDEDRRRRLDTDLWEARVRVMAAIDLMTRGTLSEGTVELLIALPVAMRSALLQEVRATIFAVRQGLDGPLFDWLEREDSPRSRIGRQPEESIPNPDGRR